MSVERLNGALCLVASGSPIDMYLGVPGQNSQVVDHVCPTIMETAGSDMTTSLLLGVNFSQANLTAANPISEAEAGSMQLISNVDSIVRFTPESDLNAGQLVGYDIAYKDIKQFRGIVPTPSNVNGITAPQNLDIAYVTQNTNLYEYDGAAWADKGPAFQYTVPGRVDDVFSFIQFQIQASGSMATFDKDAFNTAVTAGNRIDTRPGVPIDLKPYMTNPNGTGEFRIAGPSTENVFTSEIVFDNEERTVTINKDEIGDLYFFNFEFVQP